MKSQILLSLLIVSAIIAAMLFLAYAEKTQRMQNEDFWSISFVDPFQAPYAFTIDNRSSENQDFTYEIMKKDKTKVSETISVNAYQTEEILIDQKITAPFTVQAHTDKEKKSIQIK